MERKRTEQKANMKKMKKVAEWMVEIEQTKKKY